ncbi:MAG TPA: cytochrome c [Allosphingosinicella sp.]|jgi:cytochrome c556
MRRLPLLLLPLLAGCAAIARDETPFFEKGPERDRASAAELIAARQTMMHMAATLLFQEVMPVAKNGGDVKAAGHAADGLDLFGHSVAGLFPDGSEGPDSRALPAVWANKADFAARANALGEAAAQLKRFSDAGDKAGFAAQATVVARGCNGCHSLYRAEERR